MPITRCSADSLLAGFRIAQHASATSCCSQGGSGASSAAKAAAEAALAAAKTAASVRAAQEHGSVIVTETRRFAGKDVQARLAVRLKLQQNGA